MHDIHGRATSADLSHGPEQRGPVASGSIDRCTSGISRTGSSVRCGDCRARLRSPVPSTESREVCERSSETGDVIRGSDTIRHVLRGDRYCGSFRFRLHEPYSCASCRRICSVQPCCQRRGGPGIMPSHPAGIFWLKILVKLAHTWRLTSACELPHSRATNSSTSSTCQGNAGPAFTRACGPSVSVRSRSRGIRRITARPLWADIIPGFTDRRCPACRMSSSVRNDPVYQ